MIKKMLMVAALGLVALTASADDYDAAYLEGTWSLEGKRQCGANDVEQVTFDSSGGVSVRNDGRLESMGFWAWVDDVIRLHVVSSVHRLDPSQTEFEDEYSYLTIDALPIKKKKDEFEVVARVEGKLRHIVLSRCR